MDERKIVNLSGKILSEIFSKPKVYRINLKSMDNGEVFSLLTLDTEDTFTPCSLKISLEDCNIDPERFGSSDDQIRIGVTINQETDDSEDTFTNIQGFIKAKNCWQKISVNIIPVEKELYSRHGGLIETDVVLKKTVCLIGLGTVGAVVACELAKAGVGAFILIDDDRLEVGNISRHAAGIGDTGRRKVNAVADLILSINPHAKIMKVAEKISWDNIDRIRDLIKQSDLVFCSPDNRKARLIGNRICREENKVCIFAGCSTRAYKVQIIVVDPSRDSFCYQCFIGMINDTEDDIAAPSDDMLIPAYSDRPVKVEPGLNIDIAPVNTMSVKLILQYLLKDASTTLRSLDEDLVASWYIFLNRREPGTQFEKLPPLGYSIDGMRILRWYGIDVRRDPECPVCGEFKC